MRQLVSLHLVHDFPGVLQIFRMIGEQGRHLLPALEVLLTRVEHFSLLVELLACIEADQDTVRLVIVGFHKMHVVGSHALDAVLL